MEQIDWFAHESAARQRGFVQVCGIDEAGRGPLAGPVFAAAVLLPAVFLLYLSRTILFRHSLVCHEPRHHAD